MKMKVDVMSRMKIGEFSQHKHAEVIAVVSISDPDKESPMLQNESGNGIVRLLQLHFADVETGQLDCMTDSQAKSIAEFVLHVQDTVDRIIVHCEAGVSRSAGTAAAIMKYINGNDWGVFDDPGKRPNMTCYRKVINAFYEKEWVEE